MNVDLSEVICSILWEKSGKEARMNEEYIMSGMGGIANIIEKYLLERDGE